MSERVRCQALVRWIRQTGLYQAPPQLITALRQLSPGGYERVVRALLASEVDLQRDSGMLLTLAAPTPHLYWEVLWSGVCMEDPSLKAEAALALIQLQPIPQIIQDLLAWAQQERWIPERVFLIERLLYWFRDPVLWGAPEIYASYVLHRRTDGYVWSGGYAGLAQLWQPRTLPQASPQEIIAAAHDWALYWKGTYGEPRAGIEKKTAIYGSTMA